MEDAGGGTAADGEPSEPGPRAQASEPPVTDIAPDGDLILDVTFENSKETIRTARKAISKLTSRESQPLVKAKVRLAFRVHLQVLRSQSKYFDKLLGDSHFQEAQDIATAFTSLSVSNVKASDASPADLPWVQIHDDDEATHYAHREGAFADLLRILHGQEAVAKQIAMPFVTTLAVLADRFDCANPVAKYVASGLKFKWPTTNRKPVRMGDDGPRMSRASEDVLRQKILVSWLLNMPGRFQAATREIIMNGSCRWTSFPEEEEDDDASDATWWYLQEGLEQELQYRRNAILNTIASIPRHFLGLYTSRTRQCKLGYDSSGSCDSYQLGEMLKFLVNRSLLFPADFSPASLASVPDAARLLPVESLLATLRQCPGYQIDKNHTNCGLRTRLLPILDFVQALLSAHSVPLARQAWKTDRGRAAWLPVDDDDDDGGEGEGRRDEERSKPFRFTRSLAADQRLRFENAMGADRFARGVFTASSWDWTAEDQGQEHVSTTPRWSFR
ncbi:hypothetical protein F4778DRAFT_451640 [Xylariomycetidae sp. FL2044]|nr:hypothetical protein F4778DRAFT_451640 [Xylariomycetidae sp. FL2044]